MYSMLCSLESIGLMSTLPVSVMVLWSVYVRSASEGIFLHTSKLSIMMHGSMDSYLRLSP